MTLTYRVFIEIKDADQAHEFVMAHAKSLPSAQTWRRNWQLKYRKEMKSVAHWNKKTEMATQTDEPEEENLPETREMSTQTDLDMKTYKQLQEMLDIVQNHMR
jgi:hypothetical protein